MPRTLFATALFLLAAMIVGCFETDLTLGPEDQSVVDPAYCGDWNVMDKDHPSNPPGVRIVIRNLDGKRYYAEWIEVGQNGESDKSTRMIGFTADVKGVTFAHLRNLPDDGTIADKHLVMRVSVKDGVLTLRNLDEKFFADKNLASDAEFRLLVEEHLENDAMYDQGAVTATRAPGK